jgi:phosphatidylglycerol:prolipoprotein diacylglycerol transferase
MASLSILSYIYINIDPVLLRIGPLALRWYGLMYVVGIIVGLWVMGGYAKRKGITQDIVYRILFWCIAAGLIGGRLYFVIQQPNLVSYYLANPIHIIATWEGGMAFFGAIFLVIPTIYWRARVERINPLVALDCGVIFAAAGQIFGRIGNLVNGDIIGYRSTLPWSTVYVNPGSWPCSVTNLCHVPVQPAAAYELIANIVLLVFMLYLARHLRRPGILMLVYLFGYVITQFFLFFVRDNLVISFLGLNWGLKQAQWTSLVVFILLLPITYLIFRYSKPVPEGVVAARYGIPQKPKTEEQNLEPKVLDTDTDNERAEDEMVAPTSEDTPREKLETGAVDSGAEMKNEDIATQKIKRKARSGDGTPITEKEQTRVEG